MTLHNRFRPLSFWLHYCLFRRPGCQGFPVFSPEEGGNVLRTARSSKFCLGGFALEGATRRAGHDHC
ncbi:MAG: hypothetical protein CM1200mP25_0010 [Acidobacteriota bacterium]|nr:MAG: hypothetical protein CM1200mP25_0010 [Acidobacteriota bacterium]